MKTRVADPTLRREVEAAVRRRVRGDDAEDVVQATLADVLSAARVPEEPEEFRRFVFGVARNKVFDHFRRQRRYASGQPDDETAAPEPPLSARDILRWAEGELPDSESQSTLEWMLLEGDGEKLENIARDAKLPAPRVRKRVSRLRKFLRERWAAELALIGLLLVCAGVGALYWLSHGKTPDNTVKREPPRPLPSAPRERAPQRPAGSTSALPNLVAPPSALPSPSPLPSGSAEQAVKARKPLHRARPISTEQNVTPTIEGQSKALALPPSDLKGSVFDDIDSSNVSQPSKAGRKPASKPDQRK
jgi:RNA polymerase sigma factor (sigma-70 family)